MKELSLEKRLRQKRVRIDAPDGNTLFLRNVPANKGCFNKTRTNVLIKRPHAGQPYIVCVDEDLEYTGNDGVLLRAFTTAHRQAGWRVLYLEHDAGGDSGVLIENALRVLGFDGREPTLIANAPRLSGEDEGGLLHAFGFDITERIGQGDAQLTVGRDEKIEEVVVSVTQWQQKLTVVHGPSGVGKTNLLFGVARKLCRRAPAPRVVSVDLGVLMAGTLFDSEREILLSTLFTQARTAEVVLALENLEMAFTAVPRAPWLFATALDEGTRMIGTVLKPLSIDVPTLARRVQFVELNEPWPEEAVAMLMSVKDTIAEHHEVRIDEAIVRAAVDNSQWLAGSLPARAISLLDVAAARAALKNNSDVSLAEIYMGCSRFQPAGTNDA